MAIGLPGSNCQISLGCVYVCVLVCLSVCVCVSVYVLVSVFLCVCLCVFVSVIVFVSVCLSLILSVCLSVSLSACLRFFVWLLVGLVCLWWWRCWWSWCCAVVVGCLCLCTFPRPTFVGNRWPCVEIPHCFSNPKHGQAHSASALYSSVEAELEQFFGNALVAHVSFDVRGLAELQFPGRVLEIITLLRKIPGLKDEDIAASASDIQSLLCPSLTTSAVIDGLLGQDFLGLLRSFEDKEFVAVSVDLDHKVKTALAAQAEAACVPLVSSLRDVFGVKAVTCMEFKDDVELVARLSNWTVDAKVMLDLQSLGRSWRDEFFLRELSFISSLCAMMVPLARAVLAWKATCFEDQLEQMDAQKISKDHVTMIKDLRTQHAPFQRLCGGDLHKLFVEQPGHTSAFKGLFHAAQVSKDVLDTSLEMMDVVGKVWSTDLANVTNMLIQSCPAFQPMKDNLLKDENLVKAMIGNEHYARLPAVCAALEEMRRLARHQD